MIIDDLFESPQLCPECGGISFSDLILAEKKDACYYKVKASAKVWPSAYASGRLVQCRKKGADNYGNKSESINEFAPSGGDDRGPDDEEILRRLAAQWWSGTEQQMIKAQQTLEALGWEIGPDESGDDDAGVYVYRIGDHDGRDTLAFAHSELSLDEGVAEATGDQKFDTMMSRITAEPKYPDREMPPTSIPELIQWADQNNKPYHKFFAQWAQKHRFTNVNDALVWVGDNVDPYDEFGPKDHENDFGDLVGEPLIDAAKHNPKAAELLKVFKCYEEIIDDWDDEYRQMNLPENQLDEKSVSQAQFRTMAAAAHNPKFAKKVGISQDVAREFNKADKGQDYKDLPKKADESKSKPKEKEADYGDDYQDMVARVKKLAGLGPLKTVYDPNKRVYRNIPTAVQPKK